MDIHAAERERGRSGVVTRMGEAHPQGGPADRRAA